MGQPFSLRQLTAVRLGRTRRPPNSAASRPSDGVGNLIPLHGLSRSLADYRCDFVNNGLRISEVDRAIFEQRLYDVRSKREGAYAPRECRPNDRWPVALGQNVVLREEHLV